MMKKSDEKSVKDSNVIAAIVRIHKQKILFIA